MTDDIRVVTLKPRRSRKTKRSKAKREKSISALTKELDALVSRVVRLGACDSEGMVKCYTCGHKAHYKKIHCGHYITRYYKETRWNKRNLKPQCFMCNIYRKGNAIIYRRNLVLEFGEEEVKQMEYSVDPLIRGGLSREYLEKCIQIEKKSLEILESRLSTEMKI
jgi:hypothetical protein